MGAQVVSMLPISYRDLMLMLLDRGVATRPYSAGSRLIRPNWTSGSAPTCAEQRLLAGG